MALETDLQAMARHLVDRLQAARASITIADGSQAFTTCQYGEPRVIAEWPHCSVQPQNMERRLKGTRKFELVFSIDVVIYHGKVADTLEIQEGAHKRIEAVDDWLMADLQWNLVDTDDASKHKVIFGFPTALDHPIVIAPGSELWSASRLRLTGESEEVF